MQQRACRRSLNAALALVFAFAASAQSNGSKTDTLLADKLRPRLDTVTVLRKARLGDQRNLGEIERPSVRFMEDGNWEVIQLRTSHTEKGPCARTNGCTVIKGVTVVINDRTGRVVSREKDEDVYPNYE